MWDNCQLQMISDKQNGDDSKASALDIVIASTGEPKMFVSPWMEKAKMWHMKVFYKYNKQRLFESQHICENAAS